MGMSGFGFMGGIGMLLFWGAIIALLVWLVRALSRTTGGGSADAGRSAMATLEQRYARGEIDTPAFEAAKRTLER